VSRGGGSVIAVEVAGQRATPVLFGHGLADSRLSAHLFASAARELGLCLVAPDRPGIGRTDPRPLRRLADWAEDATLVLDALGAGSAALLASRLAGRSQRRARPGSVAASAASRSSRRSGRQHGLPTGWRRGNGLPCGAPYGQLGPAGVGEQRRVELPGGQSPVQRGVDLATGCEQRDERFQVNSCISLPVAPSA
jgi:pimeloyl-ACP methyl ester carboxylesterase